MAAAVALAMTLLAGPVAPAQAAAASGGPAPAAEVSRLEAECARLRTELDRTNAEVAALKRGDRGVRNDYRLRQRMADAEALARKLTAAEGQLRARRSPRPAPPSPSLSPPSAQPGDGPVELEAKADLLADQARRLAAEADSVARAAGQLRGRQTLRRRANQLDRDPFAGIDTAKRTMVFGAGRNASRPQDEQEASPGGGTKAGDAADNGAGRGSAGPAMGAPAPPTPTAGAPTAPPQASPPRGAELSAPPGPAPQPTTALSTQLRTLLDPATLAEVQRLERTGQPISDPAAMEKVAAALRQRAQALEAQARALRSRAKP